MQDIFIPERNKSHSGRRFPVRSEVRVALLSLSKLTRIVWDARERRFIRLQPLIDIKVWHPILLIWAHPIHFNLSVKSSGTCWTLQRDPAGSDQTAPSCAQNLTTTTTIITAAAAAGAAALLLSKKQSQENKTSRLLIPQNKAWVCPHLSRRRPGPGAKLRRWTAAWSAYCRCALEHERRRVSGAEARTHSSSQPGMVSLDTACDDASPRSYPPLTHERDCREHHVTREALSPDVLRVHVVIIKVFIWKFT